MSNSPFNPRVVATGVQGVPKSTGGKMAVCEVAVTLYTSHGNVLFSGVQMHFDTFSKMINSAPFDLMQPSEVWHVSVIHCRGYVCRRAPIARITTTTRKV